jgi:hypothetical protein
MLASNKYFVGQYCNKILQARQHASRIILEKILQAC